ncbi:epoxide hydrolase [Pseudomonas sp. WN033]|nr:epoxide hydrolase [Pseudomonas sp. WN033]
MKEFKIEWSTAEIKRLMDKIAGCQLPSAPEGTGWTMGCDPAFMAELQRYWTHQFDWQACIDTLNRYPQFVAEVDGFPVHFVHVRGESEGKRPLLLTHGWPGSHFEFWKVIDLLAFPSRHGGSRDQAFDLVIPSLPGFGFSGKPQGVMTQRQTAGLWNKLMTDVLGYERYAAQGGDWGGIVTSWLGLDHAQNVEAIHLNMLGFRSMTPPQNEAETAWQAKCDGAQRVYSGYASVHMFKPHSIILATADNPLGQAAWIIERFHDWADLRSRPFEQVFSMDELITNLVIYLMNDSFASAVRFYPGVVRDGFGILPSGTRCETPTTFAAATGDALSPVPPRSRVELVYNLAGWQNLAEGGHFPALEVPQLFADAVREWRPA